MYRLNLANLRELAKNINNDYYKSFATKGVFRADFDYGSEIPCEECEKFSICEVINQEYFDMDFPPTDDGDYGFEMFYLNL